MNRLILLLLFAGIHAQAESSIDRDLATELHRLAELRTAIAAEKPTLARETNRIASDLSVRRKQIRFMEIDRSEQLRERETLAARVGQLDNEFLYIDHLLLDFRKQFEARLPPAEADAQRPQLLAADETNEARLVVAENAIAYLENGFAVRTFTGEAIGSGGVAVDGRFLQAGPVVWFLSKDGKTGGLTFENRHLRSELVPGNAGIAELEKLASGQPAAPPFDPTLGSAIALGKSKGSLLDHLKKGGFWIFPILFLALVAALSAIGKWIQFSRIRELRPDVVRNVLGALKKGDRLGAEAALAGVRHPAKAMLQRGIELSNRPLGDVEEGMYEKFLETEPSLQRGLSFIAIASATAPLLGLLGTVTGMIYTFRLINIFGTSDAKSLASGISEALVTTEMGLVVAIPALILHALLSRRMQGIRSTMELTSLAFTNGLNPKEDPS